jgi:hypothetical protein
MEKCMQERFSGHFVVKCGKERKMFVGSEFVYRRRSIVEFKRKIKC